MTDVKYCPSCKRNVGVDHSWNLGLLIALLFIFVIPGLVYLAVTWKGRCPICHIPEEMLTPVQFDNYVAPAAPQAPQHP